MKKILLATTMIAATATVAAADVKISGSARMGIVQVRFDNPDGTTKTKAVFSSRVRIQFDASGTTDGGLSFGASMRADQDGGNSDGTANGSSTVFISGAFGKLTMGDVAGGAGDELVGQLPQVGYTGLSDTTFGSNINFLNGTATAARYDYTSGPLSVALGVSQTSAADGSDKASIAVKYATDKYNVALGYETVKGNKQISVKAGMTFGAATVSAKVAKNDFKIDSTGAAEPGKGKTEFGVALTYAVNPALSVEAFYTDHKDHDIKTMGIGGSYDLGGGASVVAGVMNVKSSVAGTKAYTLADVGVTMSF